MNQAAIAQRLSELEAENARLRAALAQQTSRHAETSLLVPDLAAILDTLPSMVGYWDSDQCNRFANRAYRDWFGVDHERLRGLHIRHLLGETLYQLNLPFIEGALRGEVQEFERAIPTPDGAGKRHSLARYLPDIVDGEVCGFIVQVFDVTALKETNEALRKSEQHFRALFEAAPVGLKLISSDLRLLDVNDAFCRMLGYTREELCGKSIFDFTHPDDLMADYGKLQDLLNGQRKSHTLEKRYLRKDGTTIWASVTQAGIRDADGNLHYGLGIIEDITERREAERLRFEHLEHQRDALVREVHHRIKNNLQGVISLIEQLKLKQPQAAAVLEEAAAQVDTIAVVHGLQCNTLAAEVRPRQLVEAIVASIARLAGKPIDCRPGNDSPGWEWRLNARDTVSIALVINELLYNALKHAGPDARIEVAYGSESGAFVVRVFNQPAALPTDFDFASGAGLGTGLALVTSLLPRQGARLSIRQRGNGVEATLHLSHPCASSLIPEQQNPKELTP